MALAILAALAACGGPDRDGERGDPARRRAMFEAVLRDVRREMPDAEIVPRTGADDAQWVVSLRERGLAGRPRGAAEPGWRVEIGMLDAGETPDGDPVVRTSQRLWHPGGRAEQRIAYVLVPGPGDGWRVRDARVEYVADYGPGAAPGVLPDSAPSVAPAP